MTIKEFGDLLYLLRIGKNLSIKAVSTETGIDSNFLGKIERGNISAFPRHLTLSHLADFYGFRFQYIPSQLLVISIPEPSTIEKEIEKIQEIDENIEIEDRISLMRGEIMLIERALTQTGYNRIAAAKILGIGERTLYRKLKDYNIKI